MPAKRDLLKALTHEELLDIATYSSVEVATSDRVVDIDQGKPKTVLHALIRNFSLNRLKEICRALGVADHGDDKERLSQRVLWTGDAGDEALSYAALAPKAEQPR